VRAHLPLYQFRHFIQLRNRSSITSSVYRAATSWFGGNKIFITTCKNVERLHSFVCA